MPSHVIRGGQPRRLQPFGVPILVAIISALSWKVSRCEAIDVNCCSAGSTWLNSTNCSDGHEFRLSCPFGLYKVDPDAYEFDNFTVQHTGDNAWLFHDDTAVAADKFCIVSNERTGKQIALKCFEEDDNFEPSEWKNALFCILSIVSAVFLIVTLAVYVILPELREVQDKAMMAAITSLAVSYIILSIQQVRHREDGDEAVCLTLAFLLYYAFVSTFFWLNVVAFNIWRTVWFKNFAVRDKTLFAIYCVIGWGVPTCFLVAALAAHNIEGDHLKPHFGQSTCWFGGVREMWVYFYGPIAILLALNVVYLSLTTWRLWHEYREYSGNKLRALRFKCLLYFKLVLVMGITWIFEVLSFAAGTKNNEYWIPTDILNALQGLVIFLLLVATRTRVRKLLAKKRPCGIAFPKSWVACEDMECEDVLPEELELSQQA